MNRKAIIFGIKGYKLSKNEKLLFNKFKPWGIILFSRNIKSIAQTKSLTNSIKNLFNDKKYPILIDQEGGKVSRLNKIIDLSFFSQNFFGKLYSREKKLFFNIYENYIDKVCEILFSIGININTVPVLDIRRKKSHDVIGTRSFSNEHKKVSKLGNLCIYHHEKSKIGTVIKHIPGLGLSKCDSHFRKPTINENKKKLLNKDFKPFKECKSLFAMTGHATYFAYDSQNTATHSKIIIKNVIRNYMKFKGILISDDISMKALKYGIEKNALKALYAGCNLVLHCNGNMKEMRKLANIIPNIDKFTKKKTEHFYKFLG